MLEVKYVESLKKYVVSPLSEEGKYKVVFESEKDAKSLCVQISMGMFPSPMDNPLKYQSAGVDQDGLKVFTLR